MGYNRASLMMGYEKVLESVSLERKKNIKGQISLFDGLDGLGQNEEIDRFEMLFVNEALGESFYENLNLSVDWDKWELKETEVDFIKLFYEWWKCVGRSFTDVADNFRNDICCYYKEDTINALTYFDRTDVGKFFTAFREIRKYTYEEKPKSGIYLAEGHFLKLDDKYKLYIELCDWKPTKNEEEE